MSFTGKSYETRDAATGKPSGSVDHLGRSGFNSHSPNWGHEVNTGHGWESLRPWQFRQEQADWTAQVKKRQEEEDNRKQAGLTRDYYHFQPTYRPIVATSHPTDGDASGLVGLGVLGGIGFPILVALLIGLVYITYMTIKLVVLPVAAWTWILAWIICVFVWARIWKGQVDFQWLPEMTAMAGLTLFSLLGYFVASFFDRDDLAGLLMTSSVVSLAAGLTGIGMYLMPRKIRQRWVGWRPQFLSKILRRTR